MKTTDNMKIIIARQKDILKSLESEVSELESSSFVEENEKLRLELQDTVLNLNETQEKAKQSEEELAKVKRALTVQLLQDKIAVLNSVNKGISNFYIGKSEQEQNRLREFEIQCKKRIDGMYETVEASVLREDEEMNQKISELQGVLDKKISELQSLKKEAEDSFLEARSKKYEELKNEEITKQEYEKSLGRKSWESFVGLNVFNKIGIFLIIIGVFAVGQYAFTRIGDVFKSIVIFALGALLIGAGEIFARKRNANIFSQGIISGGVAVLYVGTVVSFFVLDLISPISTIILCTAITGIAFFFSHLHSSQTISAFAVIGGYLPVIALFMQDGKAFFGSTTILAVLVVYFALLCVFAFLTSIKNKWIVSSFIGFSLNTLALSGLTTLCVYLKNVQNIQHIGFVPLVFAAFSAAVYMTITLMQSKNEDSLSTPSFILAAVNTAISSVSLFTITGIFFNDYLFAVPVALTAAFAALAYFAFVYLPEDDKTKGMFTGVGVLFSFLIVPIAWGIEATALAWIIESAVILAFSISRENKIGEIIGFITLSVSTFAFLLLDVALGNYYTIEKSGFTLETMAISFPVLIAVAYGVIAMAVSNDREDELRFRTLNYLSFVGAAALIVYAITRLSQFFTITTPDGYYEIENTFGFGSLMFILLFALSAGMPFIERLHDRVMTVLTTILTGISVIGLEILLCIESFDRIVVQNGVGINFAWLNLAAAIIASLAGVAAVILTFRNLSVDFEVPTGIMPIAASSAFIVLLTTILVNQFAISFDNPVISIIYILTAAIWIVLGFIRRYGYLRMSGLVFSFIALAKLFLLDLRGLTLEWRIVSYFAFGIILIAVSFVYQYFNKRLDKEEMAVSISEKTEE